ncbi:hypothetical protein NIES3974_31340 [Calothrix sp. NIES-3974]|nr:hypothetical protein NIES3974_31340 [Calothrix sp. NIES-3974]
MGDGKQENSLEDVCQVLVITILTIVFTLDMGL